MVSVTKDDMKVGAKLLIATDMGTVSEQVFRGKLRSEKAFVVWNETKKDWEWVNEEPDYCYLSYLNTLKFLFRNNRIFKYTST